MTLLLLGMIGGLNAQTTTQIQTYTHKTTSEKPNKKHKKHNKKHKKHKKHEKSKKKYTT